MTLASDSRSLKSKSQGSPLTYLFFGVFCFRIVREHVDGGDAIPILETLENDALPCFRLLADDLARFGLDGDALFGDADELILVIRCNKGYDLVAAAEIPDTLAVSALDMIGRGLVSLRIAVRRNGEDILICCDACADDFIIARELDPMDTGSGAAHGADLAVIHREADGHAILGAKDDLLFTGDRKHGSEAVALIEADGDETVLVDVLYSASSVFFT